MRLTIENDLQKAQKNSLFNLPLFLKIAFNVGGLFQKIITQVNNLGDQISSLALHNSEMKSSVTLSYYKFEL